MSLRYLTAGESHGKALTGIMDGMPSGLSISVKEIEEQLQRRKLGFGRGARQKIETDAVEIISGIRFGKTLGSPICLMIQNKDASAWKTIMESEPYVGPVQREVIIPRPGHADLVGGIKYHHSDMRNVLERASARETAIRVGLASIVRKMLSELGISIGSRVVQIGSVRDESEMGISVNRLNSMADLSPVRCTQDQITEVMIAEVEHAKKAGDTLGGIFEIYASGVPAGLGSYSQWDRRLEGAISKALMSLNAVKGVEIGLGFQAGRSRGSTFHDEIFVGSQPGYVRYQTNSAGGIEGGMSTSQPIVVRASMKPLATLMKPLRSVNLKTSEPELAHIERSDVCAVPAAAVIGESLLAFVLAEAVLEKFGGDSMEELSGRVQLWKQACPIE